MSLMETLQIDRGRYLRHTKMCIKLLFLAVNVACNRSYIFGTIIVTLSVLPRYSQNVFGNRLGRQHRRTGNDFTGKTEGFCPENFA